MDTAIQATPAGTVRFTDAWTTAKVEVLIQPSTALEIVEYPSGQVTLQVDGQIYVLGGQVTAEQVRDALGAARNITGGAA